MNTEVQDVLDDAAQAQQQNPQSGPKEILSLVVYAHLKDGREISEPMDVPIPKGIRNYAAISLNIWQVLVGTGGLSHKIADKEFEFYMIPDIAKFRVEFGEVRDYES